MKLVDADALSRILGNLEHFAKSDSDRGRAYAKKCVLFSVRERFENLPDASQPLREMIRRLADELSNATDPIVSLCLDKEECRSLVYEARALLKESDHA